MENRYHGLIHCVNHLNTVLEIEIFPAIKEKQMSWTSMKHFREPSHMSRVHGSVTGAMPIFFTYP